MIRILFFGPVTERTGCCDMQIEFRSGLRLQDVVEQLWARFPNAFGLVCFTAVNQVQTRDPKLPLADNDEIAFMAKFSEADMSDTVRIQTQDFSVDQELSALRGSSTCMGGIAVFIGCARDFSEGRAVSADRFRCLRKHGRDSDEAVARRGYRQLQITRRAYRASCWCRSGGWADRADRHRCRTSRSCPASLSLVDRRVEATGADLEERDDSRR